MKKIALLLIFSAVLVQVAAAEIPNQISYQAVLRNVDGTLVPDGDYNLAFKIYDVAEAGSAIWTEEQNLHVTWGVVNAYLGRVTPLNLTFETPYWISATIGDDPELSRVPMVATPYAFRSATADAAVNADTAQVLIGAVDNADRVDGHHAGNGTDQVAVSNGTLCATLYAARTNTWVPDVNLEQSVSAGSTYTFTFPNLGDPAKFIVIIDGRNTGTGQPYHQSNIGTNPVRFVAGFPTQWIGAEISQITATSVTVARGNYDDDTSVNFQWDRIRVRVWANQY